ncbi:KTSC domain-containing protein [Thalassorhabdus alkalitolerans]|uniref:KTSC domain-containing protein n=1 Tax=Thalassorhabdus alkalitolerans TaxID=2282697 RepID=A0ABW0YNC4_9BACI|nr:KTSC domain-containing protein [Thalassobacillus sp. C254]
MTNRSDHVAGAAITSVSYDEKTYTLYVKFDNNVTHIFHDIPSHIYVALSSQTVDDREQYYEEKLKGQFRSQIIDPNS